MKTVFTRAATVAALSIIALASLSSSAAAQDEVLLKGPRSFGGFGGPHVRVTQAAGETMVLSGGHGAFLINRRFAIGGAGLGGITKVDAIIEGNPVRGEMDFGYGGLTLEYITRPSKLVHATFGVLIGGGAVSVWPDDLRPRNRSDNQETFGVVEPMVGAEMNVVRWMRLGAQANYRVAIGADVPRLANDRLSGMSAALYARFGAF